MATTETYANPATAAPSNAGGAPSTRTATGSRSRPPESNCQEVRDNRSTSALHRRDSTKPTEESTIAASEASTPRMSIDPVPASSIVATPARPITPPRRWLRCGRSASTSQASSIIASGDRAITVAAMLVGSNCAAR